MKINKQRRIFTILGLLSLLIVSGVMFVGCDLSVITVGGGLVLGGVIGNLLDHIFIGILVGGVIGFILFLIISSAAGGNSNSSNTSNLTGKIMEYRNKYPNKCGSCFNYSINTELCKNENCKKSPDETCGNWRG